MTLQVGAKKRSVSGIAMLTLRMRRAFALALGALLVAATTVMAAAAAPAPDVAAPAPPLAGAPLLQALRSGGYVLYFRHTATDFSQNDQSMAGYEDCTRQRNLTDAGRADARAIGAAIRSLGIPIGAVLASPYCRTTETAVLMFGRATASPAVRGGPASAAAGRYAELERLLASPVTGGVNVVIASHGNPFVAVAGAPYLAEGEAAVIEPRGNAGFRVVARVGKDEWAALQ